MNAAPPSMPVRPALDADPTDPITGDSPEKRAGREKKAERIRKNARAPKQPRVKLTPEERRAKDEKALARAEERAARLKHKLDGKLTDKQLLAACVRMEELARAVTPNLADHGFKDSDLSLTRHVCGTILQTLNALARSQATQAHHEAEHAATQGTTLASA